MIYSGKSLKNMGVILFVFLFLVRTGQAQRVEGTNPAYYEGDWISYTQCRNVNSIQVAPTLVYVATEGGILRYDFYAHEWLFPFTVSNGLAENHILAVALNVETNLLWCSTPTAVCVYDDGSQWWRNYYLDELGIAANDPVYSIGFDESGVWLETRSGALYFSRVHEFRFRPRSQPLGASVVWSGARGFSSDELDYYFLPNSLLFVDDGSRYYIQDSEVRTFAVNYYQIDPWQKIWVGTNGLGLFTADIRIRQMNPVPFGLLNSDVNAISILGNELWIGGIQQPSEITGVTRWDVANDSWSYFEPRLISHFRNDRIRAIETSDEAVWFATDDGLTRYLPEKNSWHTYTVFDGLQDNQVFAVKCSDSTVCVGTNDGLDVLNFFPSRNDSMAIRHLSDPQEKTTIYDIYLDSHLIWAGTGYGLFVFDRDKNESGYYRGSEGPGTESVIAVSRSGDSLWVATAKSVEVLDLIQKKWCGGPARRIFSDTHLLDLAVSRSAIWIGTEDGLYKFHVRKGYWKRFSVRDGLLHPRAQRLLVDGDYLWIGSPAGLTRFYWNSPYRVD